MLILPCMNWQKYRSDFRNSRFWSIVLAGVSPWQDHIDLYAIDCIVLPSQGRMIGLWSPSEQGEILDEIIALGLDSYPSWSRYSNNVRLRDQLCQAVELKLDELSNKYRYVIGFVNVRAYYETLKLLARKFPINLFPERVNWRAARAVPYTGIGELQDHLRVILGQSGDSPWTRE